VDANSNRIPGLCSRFQSPGWEKSANVFEVGQEIYGFNDWFANSATAGLCATTPKDIAGNLLQTCP
jgi:hypothetical protein